jgi:hypothetical protein
MCNSFTAISEYTRYVDDLNFITCNLSLYGSTTLCWTLAAFSVSWHYTQSTGLLGQGISPSQDLYPHTAHTDIHASRGIRTHDPSIRAGEDSSCLRPGGHCDRLISNHPIIIRPNQNQQIGWVTSSEILNKSKTFLKEYSTISIPKLISRIAAATNCLGVSSGASQVSEVFTRVTGSLTRLGPHNSLITE